MKHKIMLALALILIFSVLVIDSGAWTSMKRITWTTDWSEHPAIAVGPGSTIHVVWVEYTGGVNEEILHKMSTDGGLSWSATTRLTYNSGFSRSPAVAVDSVGRAHVVWYDSSSSNWELYYKRRTAAGVWSTAKRLTYTSKKSEYPAITVDSSDNVYITWHLDDPVYYHTEIYFKKSTDWGMTWSTSKRITYNTSMSQTPDIAAGTGNNIYVVWDEPTSGFPEVFFKKSTNNGSNWIGTKRITYNSGFSWGQAIAVDSTNRIHVAWADNTFGNFEILYKWSNTGGSSWTGVQKISWTPNDSEAVAIVVDTSNNVHIVWEEGVYGVEELYYKMSTNAGVSWSAPVRLTYNPGTSQLPDIAADGTNVHIVWQDTAFGPGDIYYKRKY